MYQNGKLDISGIQKEVLYALEPQLAQVADESGRRQIFCRLLDVISDFTKYKHFADLVGQAIQYFNEETIENYGADVLAFKKFYLRDIRTFILIIGYTVFFLIPSHFLIIQELRRISFILQSSLRCFSRLKWECLQRKVD